MASCGYEIGGLYTTHDVRVKVFDNVSERRTYEFDLTEAVIRKMMARGIRVNGKDAPVTLEGTILDVRTPQTVAGALDVVLVGSLVYKVEIRLVNAHGDLVWRDERTESVSFTSARSETVETARQQVMDRLARWVITHFEKEW